MNSQNKKLAFGLLIGAVVIIIAVGLYWQQNKSQPEAPARPSIKEQLLDIGRQQPSEPATVYVIMGQITSISDDQMQLSLITTRGEKKVTLSPNTIIQRQKNVGRPATPPPTLIDINTPPEATQIASSADLEVGHLVQIQSLTNISGLSTFTANKLTIID